MNLQHQHILKTSQGLGSDFCTSYKWDWSVLLKSKKLKRDEYITGLLEVTVPEGYPMEGNYSREPFDFAMAVPSSTRRPTSINTCMMTAL